MTASSVHIRVAYAEEANYIEKGPAAIHLALFGTPEKRDHNKRKATIGLIACLTLGPVGYLGVLLFSHKNALVLKKAKLGLMIWIALVVIAAMILLIAQSKGSGNFQGANFDFSGGINKNKRKREQVNPQPSVIEEFPDYKFY